MFVKDADEQIVPFETGIVFPFPFDRNGKKS
jgi:hypothetical protein